MKSEYKNQEESSITDSQKKRVFARLVSRELPKEVLSEISGSNGTGLRCWHTKDGKFDAIDCQ